MEFKNTHSAIQYLCEVGTKRGLSISEIAEKSGMHKHYLNQLRTGSITVTKTHKLMQIAKAVKCKVEVSQSTTITITPQK